MCNRTANNNTTKRRIEHQRIEKKKLRCMQQHNNKPNSGTEISGSNQQLTIIDDEDKSHSTPTYSSF
jgi:hypothetical protein